jgi:hypothetical protein
MSHVDAGQFHAWLDGEMTERETQRLEEHLAQCDACNAVLEEEARLHAKAGHLMVDVAATATPAWKDVLARAGDAGEAAQPAGPASRGVGAPVLRRLAWAASVALAFALGWYVRVDVGDPRRVVVQAPSPQEEAAAPAPTAPAPAAPAPTRKRLLADSNPGAARAEREAAEQRGAELRALAPPQARRPDVDGSRLIQEPQAGAWEGSAATDERLEDAGATANYEAAAADFRAAAGGAAPLRLDGGVVLEASTAHAFTVEGGTGPAFRTVYRDAPTGAQVTVVQAQSAASGASDTAASAEAGRDTGAFTTLADGRGARLRWETPNGLIVIVMADVDEAELRRLAARLR